MIPKEFEFRESLPKTMIGKVNYRELEKENKGHPDKTFTINIDNITTAKLSNAKVNIKSSYVLNATIANQLESNSEVATPESAFDEITTSYKLLSSKTDVNCVRFIVGIRL